MKFPSVHLLVIASCLGLLTAVAACGSKSKPAAPTAPTTQTVTPALSAPSPTGGAPTGGTQLTASEVKLEVTNATATGTVGTVKYRFEVSEKDDFPADDRYTIAKEDIDQGSGSTSWTVDKPLQPNFVYYWRARAYSATITNADWSKTESFRTQNVAFRNGQNIYDPLTNGKTVASRIVGGHFVTGDNGGWEANGLGDGLDYDIPTCASCKVEFDVTNFGNGEGSSIAIDVKWFSMGDAATMNDFIAFRNSPWKMHLEQRSDGDGSGMQLIWRNGATDDDSGGDPEYGDHRGKFLFGGPAWGHSYDNTVWHFIVEWTRETYKISIGKNGGAQVQWFPGPGGDSGYFNTGHPYAPPNHRIELGCIARQESMPGARYRNFKVTPQ